MLYKLWLMGYDDNYEIFLFEGPEVEDWKSFCHRLLPEALRRTWEKFPNGGFSTRDTITELIEILFKHGYNVVRPPTVIYHDDIDILEFNETRKDKDKRLAKKTTRNWLKRQMRK